MPRGTRPRYCDGVSDTDLWLALATTLALAGAAWQVVLALVDGIESMEQFLAAKNAIMREERDRIRRAVPSWRLLKRRRELKNVEGRARGAMTENELRLERRFDRQGYAWSLVVAAALMATIASWISVFAG